MFPHTTIFGVNLYEIFLTVGMLVALFSADRMGVKRGFSIKLQRLLIVAGVGALLLGMFGAILFQAVYDYIATGVFSMRSGMTFYGGLIFGVAFFLLLWFGGAKLFKIFDEAKKQCGAVASMAAVLIPMAHGFGRLGCLCAGCCHGKPTDAWYGVEMLIVENNKWVWQKVVPVQLFEAAFLLTLSGVLLWLYFRNAKTAKRTDGGTVGKTVDFPLMPVYMTVYGVWRFFIEYARADDRGQTVISFLTPSQLIAVLLFLGGVAYFAIWYVLKKRSLDGQTPTEIKTETAIEGIENNKTNTEKQNG